MTHVDVILLSVLTWAILIFLIGLFGIIRNAYTESLVEKGVEVKYWAEDKQSEDEIVQKIMLINIMIVPVTIIYYTLMLLGTIWDFFVNLRAKSLLKKQEDVKITKGLTQDYRIAESVLTREKHEGKVKLPDSKSLDEKRYPHSNNKEDVRRTTDL